MAVQLPIIAVLLFVTIVGIPLGLFLLALALALVYSIGSVHAQHAARCGRWRQRSRRLRPSRADP